jgi:hypothetical protein
MLIQSFLGLTAGAALGEPAGENDGLWSCRPSSPRPQPSASRASGVIEHWQATGGRAQRAASSRGRGRPCRYNVYRGKPSY